MISKTKSRYWKQTHKYGIEIPKNYKHAMQLDEQNGTNLWWIAWEKETKNVQVAFDLEDEGEVAPVRYQEIGCHLIFDIKATTLTRKVFFVAGGHTMGTPAAMTYVSVVLRESMWIALLIADLNVLDVCRRTECVSECATSREGLV